MFEDADVDAAARDAAALKFLNAGQVCVNLNRLFIHENVFEEFKTKFIEHAKALVLGSGLTEGVNFGPLLNQMGLDKTDSLVKDAVAKGATLELGGKRREDLGPLFYEPTVLSDVSASSKIYYEEIFGPVAPLYSFSSEDAVLSQANDTDFGLAAYFYTQNLSRAWRMSHALEVANLSVNAVTNYVGSPWGGHRVSGIRGGSGRLHTLEQHLEHKAVMMNML